MHVTVVEASYQTTIAIVFAGVAPLIWSPIANVYGRRPIFVFVTAIGVAAHAAAGASKSWSGILASRAFVGIGTSAGMGIGAATVADMYFMHERGRYMGFYVVFISNGAHVAAIIGGYVARYAGWRWDYWLGAVVLGVTWLVLVFALPETLYVRGNETEAGLHHRNGSWLKLLTFQAVHKTRKLRAWDFTHVFMMLKYPSVLFPTIYYSLSFGFASVLFAVTGAAAFGSIYHMDTVGVGLSIGLSTFAGTLIGELLAGPVSDRLLYLYRKTHDGEVKSEARLHSMWPGFILTPVGIIIEGVCFQYKTHYMGPIMGIAIAAFGLQIVSTNVYAYTTDVSTFQSWLSLESELIQMQCYKPQSAEISTLLNLGRQTFSFTLGFYAVPFAEHTTWGVAWAVFAIIDVVFFLGLIALMWKGAEWRERMGAPRFDRDL